MVRPAFASAFLGGSGESVCVNVSGLLMELQRLATMEIRARLAYKIA